MKITLQYKCRRCGGIFFEPKIDYLQNIEQIKNTPSLFLYTHKCCADFGDGSERFGICDLVGCKVEK